MPGKKLSHGLTVVLALATAVLLATGTRAAAQKATVLHSFNGKNGNQSYAGLIFDAAGNLYGTTSIGGAYNGGTVFELSPKEGGGWAKKVLHDFKPNEVGGSSPYGNLILDAADNLYGTTSHGGVHGSGTVFELTRNAGGGWKEKLLYSFGAFISDGAFPYSSVVFDTAGNLYGTTAEGGGVECFGSGCGTVFELMPTPGGGWKEKILHRFQSNGMDGIGPIGGVIFDAAGDIYGTTSQGGGPQCSGEGGAPGCGTVFELAPNADGTWTETLIYAFSGNYWDGVSPYSDLVFDKAGNLYGTTYDGGEADNGTVFELTPEGGGSWVEKILHAFGEHATDGTAPYAGVIVDTAGNLYGTTTQGDGYVIGTVFELTPVPNGGWTETVLHRFNGRDGSQPWAGVISDGAGNLYGTTYAGGAYGDGTVFEIRP